MASIGRRRLAAYGAATAAGLIISVLPAAPAAAHITIAADNPQAGARNVTIRFTGETQSAKAGISAERVALPDGIAIGDVQLVAAPDGWTFSAGTDGYTISGPALRPGTNAMHTIRVAQLPAGARTLAFKTLETYSDGTVARWVDLPEPGGPAPDHPAPILTLRPAAAASTATGSAAAAAPPDVPDAASNTTGTVTAIGLMFVALLVVVGVLLLVVRSRRLHRQP